MIFPVEVILKLLLGLLGTVSLGHVHAEFSILSSLLAVLLSLVSVSLHFCGFLLLVQVVNFSLIVSLIILLTQLDEFISLLGGVVDLFLCFVML